MLQYSLIFVSESTSEVMKIENEYFINSNDERSNANNA